MAEQKIVAICPIQGDGEHKLVVLVNDGRLFERVRDPKAMNYNPGYQAPYIWKRIPGPFDEG